MMPRAMLVLIAALACTEGVAAQRCTLPSYLAIELTESQIAELDREGALIADAMPGKPVLDCPDVLDRVVRSQLGFLERNAGYYVMLPNGDVLNAYRGLRLREIENEMRSATGHTLERLEREYYELAPGGPHLVLDEDGSPDYRDNAPGYASDRETVYEYVELPPMHERPARPQAATRAAHPIFGSVLDEHRGNDFHIERTTEHWLIGHLVIAGECTRRHVAVLREGAWVVGARLERACVLWPLDPPSENRSDDDQSTLVRYVALNADDFIATPAELACAAEQDRAALSNYTVRSERFREKRTVRVPSGMVGYVDKQVEHGPGRHRVRWRSSPVTLRIVDHDTHRERRERQIIREDAALDDADADPTDSSTAITHSLELRDGRVLEGRLVSEAHSDPVEFIVVVGSIEQRMTFARSKVRRVLPSD